MSLEFTAVVENLSAQGLGTVRDHYGKVYFVRAAWPGDRGTFRSTTEYDGRYQFAELISLDSPSIERRAAPCPHFGTASGQCYGCPWMIATDQAQAQRKLHRLRYAFERTGLNADAIRDLWQAPSPFSYRARAQFKTDGTVIGYAGPRGEGIAPIEGCMVLSPAMSEKLGALKARLARESVGWRPAPPHLWNFLDLDEETDAETLSLNRRRPFQQAHKFQNERMKAWVREHAEGQRTLELFAGSGNFTEVLATGGREVAAFEVDAAAVYALNRRQLPGVRGERLDLYKTKAMDVLRTFPTDQLFVNPPRAGLMRLTRLARRMPEIKAILYVSCDVQSLVSDLQKLEAAGFKPSVVQPVDQMPQTPHLETLVKLIRD